MRTHALEMEAQSRTTDPSLSNKRLNKWSRFLPRTNVLWLEYLLFTLVFRSQQAIVPLSSEAAEGLQKRIHGRLMGLTEILEGKDEEAKRKRVPQSAREVVRMALREGLVTEGELGQVKRRLED